MKTKQEQIEEIAKIIDEMYWVYDTTAGDIAEGLYNTGYRKILENAVVLTKEEYIDLSRNYVTEQIEQVRKETAKEILQEWADDNSSMGLDNTFVNNIAKRYGIEVEE